jgi:hypothetical protein
MVRRIDIPEPIVKAWLKLREDPHKSNTETGEIIRANYPEWFKAGNTPKSINAALNENAHRLGLEVPHRKSGLPPRAMLRYHNAVPELEFSYRDRVLVISDLHASAHDMKYVERAAAVIEQLEISTVVYNGDQLDNAYLGHKGIRSRFSAPFEENVHQFGQIANLFYRAGARENFVIQGNHDDKPLRGTDGETTYPAWWQANIAPVLDAPEDYNVTHRYYATMQPEIEAPWPWRDGYRNFPWVFMHAKEYSIIPGRTAKMHGDVRPSNIINGHDHHLVATKHPSGNYWSCSAGTGQHRDGAEYKVNRPTKHPEWMPGFITLIHNYPLCWHLDMPEEMFRFLLRGQPPHAPKGEGPE